MKKKLLLFFNVLVLLNPIMGQNWLPDTDTATAQEPDEFGTVTDKDGNVYQTARFGDTWWMLENLRCKTFNDGTPLYSFDDIEATRPKGESYWSWFGEPSYAYPAFDQSNVDKYGLLYTWRAAADVKESGGNSSQKFIFNYHGGLLPEGWKLADTTAWFDLSRRMMSEAEIIGSWVTRNTPQGGKETVFEIDSVYNIGLYLKTGRSICWNDCYDLPRKNDVNWNKSKLGITGSGKVGSDTQKDNSILSEGLNEFAWLWTDNFVHSDSTGNGRRYIYFTSTSNALTVRTNHKSNHGTVRGIKRVSQISDEEEDTIINKIGIVSETDDFLIYPNRISKVFNLLSVKESKYQIYSLNGLCVKNDYIIRGTNIIDISLLSPGAYILKIEDKDFKIIKE